MNPKFVVTKLSLQKFKYQTLVAGVYKKGISL